MIQQSHSWAYNGTFFFFFFSLFILFIYFWLSWVFVAVCMLSLVAVSGGYFLLWCAGFSLRWLLLWSTGSRHVGFSGCGMLAQQLWLMRSRAQALQLWHTGLVALWHVGSSWTRNRTALAGGFSTTAPPEKPWDHFKCDSTCRISN